MKGWEEETLTVRVQWDPTADERAILQRFLDEPSHAFSYRWLRAFFQKGGNGGRLISEQQLNRVLRRLEKARLVKRAATDDGGVLYMLRAVWDRLSDGEKERVRGGSSNKGSLTVVLLNFESFPGPEAQRPNSGPTAA